MLIINLRDMRFHKLNKVVDIPIALILNWRCFLSILEEVDGGISTDCDILELIVDTVHHGECQIGIDC